MNIAYDFITDLVKHNTYVQVYLTNGIKLDGVITNYGEDAVMLTRKGVTQLVFRQALATVLPVGE